jgi:hypothetical protein
MPAILAKALLPLVTTVGLSTTTQPAPGPRFFVAPGPAQPYYLTIPQYQQLPPGLNWQQSPLFVPLPKLEIPVVPAPGGTAPAGSMEGVRPHGWSFRFNGVVVYVEPV